MSDVSVVIPCHNAAAYVGQAIDSVLAQSDVPREIVVVDDGSTDATAEVVNAYARGGEERVILLRQAKSGVSKARNAALARATGAFVAFLDADDVWLPEKTAAQLRAFQQHPQAAGVHCRVFNFENTLDDRHREETERAKDDPSVRELIEHHWVTTSAAMVRREALGDLRFDESTGHAEDMILFADLRLAGPWRMVDAALVGKRIHPGQVTRAPWHRVWAIETRIKWCRSRAERIGAEAAASLEDALGRGIVRFLEDLYWRREMGDLDAMRRHVAGFAPRAMEHSFLARRRLYPAWVYRVADALRRGV